MKFIKKRNQFEASNVSCNTQTMEAYSYAWWKFVGVINGKVIFNNATYSPSTNKHQSKVRRLLDSKGLSVDLTLRFTRHNLSLSALENEITLTQYAIKGVQVSLASNRRKKALDTQRNGMIEFYREHIRQVEIVLHGTELNASLN